VSHFYIGGDADDRAQEKGVLLLGECGLDPGIDSMSAVFLIEPHVLTGRAAMRILDRVRREGKKVTSFVSWCGGLPEPSASNVHSPPPAFLVTNGQVPLGYKFSWSPKAVLTAALNPASYKLDDQLHSIPGAQLLASHFADVPLWKGLALEGLANRDSLPYAEKYGMGEVGDLKNLFRGTLRYVLSLLSDSC
jgi:alpha-aminoadipic semialdehyde synthase